MRVWLYVEYFLQRSQLEQFVILKKMLVRIIGIIIYDGNVRHHYFVVLVRLKRKPEVLFSSLVHQHNRSLFLAGKMRDVDGDKRRYRHHSQRDSAAIILSLVELHHFHI